MDALATSDENPHTNRFFECDYLLAECWLRQEKPLGSARKIGRLGNGNDVFEKPEFKMIRHSSDASVGGFWSEAHRACSCGKQGQNQSHLKNQECQSGTTRYPV